MTVTTNPSVGATGAVGFSTFDVITFSGKPGLPTGASVLVSTVGTWAFTAPTSLVNIVAACGGGAKAAAAVTTRASSAGGGGGEAGCAVIGVPLTTTAGTVLTITVGAGGAGVAAGSGGQAPAVEYLDHTSITAAPHSLGWAAGDPGIVGGATTGGTGVSGGALGDAPSSALAEALGRRGTGANS